MDSHYYLFSEYVTNGPYSWIESGYLLSTYIKHMFNDCTFVKIGNFTIQIYHCDKQLFVLSEEKLPITEEVKTFVALYEIK